MQRRRRPAGEKPFRREPTDEASTMTEFFEMTVEAGVMHLTFTRIDRKNAMTAEMYTALAQALQAAEADDRVGAILFSGAGDSFSAGNDLGDFLDNPPEGLEAPLMRFVAAIMSATRPLVAAVHGHAVGIGTTLLLHCDLVYAAEDARFRTPFVDLGLCPEAGSSFLLPLLAGRQRAASALLLGEPFDAQAAQQMGLVTEVLPHDALFVRARDRAEALARKPRAALFETRRLVKKAWEAQLQEAFAEESAAFSRLVRGPEAREACAAFVEKRHPDRGGER